MLYVQEEHVNVSKGRRIGDDGPYEFDGDTLGEVYHTLRKHYHARCTGKVYIDMPVDANHARMEFTTYVAKPVGWVFVFKDKYEDTGGPFIHEVWVTVHTAPPTRTTEYHYAEVKP